MVKRVELESIIVRSQEILESDIDDEKVMMSLENNEYYGLNPVAKRIWELTRNPIKVNDIIETLLDEYNVDREQCIKESLELLQELKNKGLLDVQEA